MYKIDNKYQEAKIFKNTILKNRRRRRRKERKKNKQTKTKPEELLKQQQLPQKEYICHLL